MGVKESDICAPLELPALIKEIDQCIDTLSTTWDCATKMEFLKTVKEGRYQILCIINKIRERNCHKDVNPAKEDLRRDIFQCQVEYEFEQMRIDHLRKEWTRQQNKMAQLQETFYKKCRLLTLHSNYSSTQGNALCSILAALMGNQNVVINFLADDKYLVDFIKIADGCLFSFTRTYASDTPLVDSTDYKFVLALYTCIAYITAVAKGSLFLIKRQEGQKALWSLIHVLPRIEHETAEKLIVTLWKILYNISKEEEGKTFLQDCSELPSTLEHYVCRKYHPEIHKYTLETFDQVTKNITNEEFLDKVTTMSSVQRLKELSGSMYELVKYIPKKILQNITRAAANILKKTQVCPSTGAIPCDCDTKEPLVPEPESKSKTSIITKHTIRIPPGSSQAAIRMVQKFTPGQAEPGPSSAVLLNSRPSSFLEVAQPPPPMAAMTPLKIEPLESCPLCYPPCRQLFEHPSSFKPESFSKWQSSSSAQLTCPWCKQYGPVQSSHTPKPKLSKYHTSPYSITSCASPNVRNKECYVVMSAATSVKPSPTNVDKSLVGNSYQISKSFVSPSGHTKVHISRLRNPSNDKNTQVCVTKSIGTVMSKKSIKTEDKDVPGGGTPPCYCIFSCNIKKFSFGKRRQKSLSYVLPYKPKPKKKKYLSSSISSIFPSTYPSIYTEDSEKLLSLFSSSAATSASITLTKKVNKSVSTSTNVRTSDTLVEANTSIYNTEENIDSLTEKSKKRASSIPVLIPKSLSQTIKQTSSLYLSSHSCSSKDYSQNSCICSKGKKPSLIPIATFRRTSTLLNRKYGGEPRTPVTSRTVSHIPVAKKSLSNGSQQIKSCTYEEKPTEDKDTSKNLNESFSTDESIQCGLRTSSSKFKQIISPLESASEKSEYRKCKIFYDTWNGNEQDAPTQIHDDALGDERKTLQCIADEELENDDDEYEDMIDSEICTCGSKSDKQLVPWSAKDHMIATLGEQDRRVYSHSKTMRILNTINNKTSKKQQKVITRIKIPNLPFCSTEPHS